MSRLTHMNGGALLASRVLWVLAITIVISVVTPFAFTQEFDGFGVSVGISGDYAIVGATSNVAAYIFRRTGTNEWEDVAMLHRTDFKYGNRRGTGIGGAVAISGDYAVVGAPTSSEESARTAGAKRRSLWPRTQSRKALLASRSESAATPLWSVAARKCMSSPAAAETDGITSVRSRAREYRSGDRWQLTETPLLRTVTKQTSVPG